MIGKNTKFSSLFLSVFHITFINEAQRGSFWMTLVQRDRLIGQDARARATRGDIALKTHDRRGQGH